MKTLNNPLENTTQPTDQPGMRSLQVAWLTMIGLCYAGFFIVQWRLHDYSISLIFLVIAIIGMVSPEVHRALVGSDSRRTRNVPTGKRLVVGRILSIALVVVSWILFDAANGDISIRTFIIATINGAALAAFLWWKRRKQAHERS